LTGYTREELLTVDPSEFMSGHPDYTFEHAINYIQQAVHKPQLFEWLGKRKDGTLCWYEVCLKCASIGGTDRILAFFHEINLRKQVQSELIESQNILRELTSHLQIIREEERANLAREVHDVLGQLITAIKMDMTWLNKKITNKDEVTEERFKEMFALADEMVKTVRKISRELRPGILDDLGLIPALEWQSMEFEKRTGIPCKFTTDGNLPEMTKTNATGIFRVCQETLTNVARHAQATHVDVLMNCNGASLTLLIADNGKGLNAAEMKTKKTLGIAGMKERAVMMKGMLTVQNRVEGGTLVTLSVPVPAKKHNDKTHL
jgi:PAS domain S-box-containing protein